MGPEGKGPLGEDRLRVCMESSKFGRIFICFVALILASYIRHVRDTKPELSKAFPSMAAILEDMQQIRCIEHDGHRKFITPFVGNQLLICDAFGFEIPDGCRPTYTSKKPTKGSAVVRLNQWSRIFSTNNCKTQINYSLLIPSIDEIDGDEVMIDRAELVRFVSASFLYLKKKQYICVLLYYGKKSS